MRKIYFLLFLFIVSNSFSQENDEYLKLSEMKGFPASLKILVSYDKIKSNFEFFDIDEKSYNSIFYTNYIVETGQRANFRRLNIISTKKLILEPKLFENYKLVLNPKLEEGHYSKHYLGINIREESITAEFQTKYIEFIFPSNILQTKNDTETRLLIKLKNGIKYNNVGYWNEYSGFEIEGIEDFTISPSHIPNSFIELNKFDNAKLKFISNEAQKFPYLIFENNKLSSFVDSYTRNNNYINNTNLKEAGDYKSAILLQQIVGQVNFQKPIKCEISEIYFFENIIAGIITFPMNEKKKLIEGMKGIKKGKDFKLNVNGDFPTIYEIHKNTYFKLEQDFNSIKMYFITVK